LPDKKSAKVISPKRGEPGYCMKTKKPELKKPSELRTRGEEKLKSKITTPNQLVKVRCNE